jgi:hypothetical protein
MQIREAQKNTDPSDATLVLRIRNELISVSISDLLKCIDPVAYSSLLINTSRYVSRYT